MFDMNLLRTAGVALCVLVSGCATVGPDFEKPEAQVADSWLEAHDPRVDTSSSAYQSWWEVFNDPVLNGLIEMAYSQNLNLQVAGLRVLEARAQLGIATGLQYPQSQTVGASYARSRSSENAPPFSNLPPTLDVSNTVNIWALNFNIAWEADIWGRFRRGIESADANFAASMLNYDAVLVTLTGDVALLYNTIRTLDQRIIYTRANVKIQEKGLDLAQARFDFGATSELDVKQSESLLYGTRAVIPQFELTMRQAKNALSILLGMPPTELDDMLAEAGKTYEQVVGVLNAPKTAAVGIPADLIRRRPDVRRAEMAAAAQSAAIGVAKADLYPSFILAGSIGLAGESFSDQFDSGSSTGFISPLIDWNIFNYGRIKNNVRVQDARFQQLVVTYQNVVLNAAREVEDGLISFLRSQDEVAELEKAIAASEKSVELSTYQYEQGLVDYQRVLTSYTSLLGQQDNVAIAQGNIARGLIATYRALGGGWQLHQGQPWVHPETMQVMSERTNWGDILQDQTQPAHLQEASY